MTNKILKSIYDLNPDLYLLWVRLAQKSPSLLKFKETQHYRERRIAEYLLVSPTNCGRTWLRVMLGRLICKQFNINDETVNYHYLYSLSQLNPYVPCIKAIHERFGQFGQYDDQKVILLVRDPRDAVISRYMQHEYQEGNNKQDLIDYLFKDLPEYYLDFYNNWQKNKTYTKDFMLVRYEDLKVDCQGEMKKIINFIGIETTDDLIEDAINYASFENMRKAELVGDKNIKAGVCRQIQKVV